MDDDEVELGGLELLLCLDRLDSTLLGFILLLLIC